MQLAAVSMVTAALDSTRIEMIAIFGEVTGKVYDIEGLSFLLKGNFGARRQMQHFAWQMDSGGVARSEDVCAMAKRAVSKATFVLNVALEEEFETPLDELRKRLNIEAAPEFPSTE